MYSHNNSIQSDILYNHSFFTFDTRLSDLLKTVKINKAPATVSVTAATSTPLSPTRGRGPEKVRGGERVRGWEVGG